ncbi:preprotein translocase subunit SecE [Endomicrobium proavitum]|uniref:Protein translocase subunit SecE n=1 Tax=Endomicrobium proavitum TaxID=1408281 RepID=A0A0G3WL00_9BACT|nr:preprotein translocase subunit SecE [Endomicrobium proavitum]AKL98179.1 Protein translocase subunit SecE [Endomicrobium proavitum]
MNFFAKTVQFFKDAYRELAKVTWLGKKEVVATTILVVIFVLIMAAFVSVVDLVLGGVIGRIL